jgi:hypothetical protein
MNDILKTIKDVSYKIYDINKIMPVCGMKVTEKRLIL